MPTTWEQAWNKKKYPSLTGDASADVVIIGGGITGILNAYFLSRAGRKVILLEKGELGSGATLATTAFITQVVDSDFSEIADIFDVARAKSVWASHGEAIRAFDDVIRTEDIDCEFTRCSNFIFAQTKKQFETIQEEAKAYKKLGFQASLSEKNELGFKNFGYLEVPNQAKFHPAKFLSAILEIAEHNGVQIFENTEAVGISGEGPVTVTTKKGGVVAEDVIIATYKPMDNEKTRLKKAFYRSYIIEARIPKDTFPEAIYEDESNPYNYFRIDPQNDHDRMIIGGQDHKDIFGNTLVKKSFKGLEEVLGRILGKTKHKIVNRWYGPISEPSDGLALIGAIKPHYYVATGFSGNGMTHSMISALMFQDLIAGRKNKWVRTYDPKRFLFKPKKLSVKAKDYVEEFFGGAFKNLLK